MSFQGDYNIFKQNLEYVFEGVNYFMEMVNQNKVKTLNWNKIEDIAISHLENEKIYFILKDNMSVFYINLSIDIFIKSKSKKELLNNINQYLLNQAHEEAIELYEEYKKNKSINNLLIKEKELKLLAELKEKYET